ncbi:MAG: TolC family protein [Bacteroidetes bacterium]|nr:TolC family protein [Bacteroidota bacterium]MBU1719842.1 TolC family protein [Bacteroidota bacterium]
MKRLTGLIVVLFLWLGLAQAQQVITLEQAIQLALKNNYAIQVAKNETEISKNEATAGNAGMLPQLSLNSGATFSSSNTHQEFATGTTVDKNGAVSTGVSAGVALNWTLFDGMKMFVTRDKLNELSSMSEIELKIDIENTVEDICVQYYKLVKQKQLIKAIENNLELYKERIKIAEAKLKIGSESKLDYLQAKVDMNEQTSDYLKQKNTMSEMKIALNKLLASQVDSEFDVVDSIVISYSPTLEELKTTAIAGNTQLQWQQKNIDLVKYTLRELEAQRYPKLVLNSAYNFTRTDNQAGMVLYNRNLGPSAGLTLSWNIFNGRTLNSQIQNSQLLISNSELLLKNTRSHVEGSLLQAFISFNNAKTILELEEENLLLAKENVDVALERFRLGSSNSIQLKEAQRSYEDAQTRLVNARYETKIAEISLMKLNGTLVK